MYPSIYTSFNPTIYIYLCIYISNYQFVKIFNYNTKKINNHIVDVDIEIKTLESLNFYFDDN